MLKTVYAVAAAAIVAGAFIGFLSLSMQVEAHARVSAVKGDRADVRPLARDCSQHAWPYFEASCLRDTRFPFGQAHEARFGCADALTLTPPSVPAPQKAPT